MRSSEIHASRRSLQTDIPHERYDVVIVGAGVSGLSLASLLAKSGRSVLVLESINYPGGCASSYEKDGAWYDVGATTFCGADPGQPLSFLFSEIGTCPGLLPSDPTLSVQLNKKRIDLTTDRSAWKERTSEFFGKDQSRFWQDIFSVSDAVYGALGATPFLPPLNVSEFLSDLPGASVDLVSRLPLLFTTVRRQMERRGVDTTSFIRFVDAQLLITNQTNAADAYMLNGALGLSYANGKVYSVEGGMITFARFLEGRAIAFGADVRYLQRVTSIGREGTDWTITTARRHTVRARQVVTQVPLFNLPMMTDGPVRSYFERVRETVERADVPLWGAVTMYALIPDDLPRGFPLNIQVILDEPMPTLGSATLFCTFSHEQDAMRCPAGYRTMSISTHVMDDWLPADISPEDYARLKNVSRDEILSSVRRSVPQLEHLQPVSVEIGTPKTFRKYTGRHDGRVGGIPLSKKIFPWKYPKPVTPFPGLYTMGDTFFPGQGIPGVVLGALGIHRRITFGDRS